ncbi:MAG: hypothetical protein HY696_06465 [Deltaproteobacteria bacterium]|nr:hypothetical protein [Deltaproteobacteria bacterium]
MIRAAAPAVNLAPASRPRGGKVVRLIPYTLRPSAVLQRGDAYVEIHHQRPGIAIANPWPQLTRHGPITAFDLARALCSKAAWRTLMRGGPIMQPGPIWVFRRDDQALAPLVPLLKAHSIQRLADFSPDPRFVHPRDIVDFEQFAQGIAAGTVPLPIIFKPNHNAYGWHIFITTGRHDQAVEITMAHCPDQRDGDAAGMLHELGNPDEIRVDSEKNLVHWTVRRDRHDIADTLYRLWARNAVNLEHRLFDAGMAERMIRDPAWQMIRADGGRCYETRHKFVGSLATGRVFLLNSANCAKLGASSFIANITGRPASDDVRASHMYEPLLAGGHLQPHEFAAFRDYVDGLVLAAFTYLVQRLRAAGVHADFGPGRTVHGCFDLMWLAPIHGRGFPRPLLVEGAIPMLKDFGRAALQTLRVTE